ncbi:MAG: hypothetical protein SGCHY_000460 [Lobulomycetales sp.]
MFSVYRDPSICNKTPAAAGGSGARQRLAQDVDSENIDPRTGLPVPALTAAAAKACARKRKCTPSGKLSEKNKSPPQNLFASPLANISEAFQGTGWHLGYTPTQVDSRVCSLTLYQRKSPRKRMSISPEPVESTGIALNDGEEDYLDANLLAAMEASLINSPIPTASSKSLLPEAAFLEENVEARPDDHLETPSRSSVLPVDLDLSKCIFVKSPCSPFGPKMETHENVHFDLFPATVPRDGNGKEAHHVTVQNDDEPVQQIENRTIGAHTVQNDDEPVQQIENRTIGALEDPPLREEKSTVTVVTTNLSKEHWTAEPKTELKPCSSALNPSSTNPKAKDHTQSAVKTARKVLLVILLNDPV